METEIIVVDGADGLTPDMLRRRLIDEALNSYKERDLVSTAEVVDLLLDLRITDKNHTTQG